MYIKKQVSEIFIKHGLPTRQVAINEIVALFTQSVGEIIREDEVDFLQHEDGETPEEHNQVEFENEFKRVRNNLRAEQRARLATLIKQY